MADNLPTDEGTDPNKRVSINQKKLFDTVFLLLGLSTEVRGSTKGDRDKNTALVKDLLDGMGELE